MKAAFVITRRSATRGLIMALILSSGFGWWFLAGDRERTPGQADIPVSGDVGAAINPPGRAIGISEPEGPEAGGAEVAGALTEKDLPVPSGWQGAQILSVKEWRKPDADAFRRVTLLEPTDLPERIRVEEKIAVDRASGAETVLARTEMVADHVLFKAQAGESVGVIERMAAGLGGVARPHRSRPDLYYLILGELRHDGVPDALKALQTVPELVAYAEPDYVVHALQAVPDDTRFGELWGMNNTGQSGGVADTDIDAPEGWAIRSEAGDIIVAIVDTGIRYTHEDLNGNMWVNEQEAAGIPGSDDDFNGYVDDIFGINAINGSGDPDDDNEHGTHVAGIVGAVGNNGTGIAGVTWNVQLMALKFLSASGSGTLANGIEAIDYGISHGARIINNSWGGGGFSRSLEEVIEDARGAGVIFVSAAGNESSDNDTQPSYPANYPSDNMISVASITRNETLSAFSNTGETTVDIAAPGSSVLSTGFESDTSYQTLSGTSMATPHVSGILALLAAEFPGEGYLTLINRLYGSADTVDLYSGKMRTGGRANLHRALALTEVVAFPEITVPVGELIVALGQPITLSAEISGGAPITYQWSKDGVLIEGADTEDLFLSAVTAEDAGFYRLTAFNPAGQTTSSGTLEVFLPDPFIGEAVNNIGLVWVTSGDAPWEVDVSTGGTDDRSAVSGSIADRQKSRLGTTVTGPGTISFAWKVSSENGWDFVNFLVGGELQDRISGERDWTEAVYEVPEGIQTLEWTYAKDTSVSEGEDRGWVDDVLFAVNGIVPPGITEQPKSRSVLVGTGVVFTVSAVGTPVLSYQWRRGIVEISEATTPVLNIEDADLSDAGEYSVVVSNEAGAIVSAPAFLSVQTVAQAPSIIEGPQSQTVETGDTVVLSVEVSGTSPFFYQWRRNGALLRNGSRSTLTIASITVGDAGSYTVTVGNTGGTVGSVAAVLTVIDTSLAPSIVKHPESQTAVVGDGVTFLVEATGESPLSYQWRKNGEVIGGATADSFTIANAQLSDSGAFTVTVSNPIGETTSNPAELTVLFSSDNFGEGVDSPELFWGTIGEGLWFYETNITHDGVDALQSGDISDGESSSLLSSVTGPGFISFWWRVSSEEDFDFLRFKIDGIIFAEASGETGWAERGFSIPPGEHELAWEYQKDSSVSVSADAGWLDEVSFIPADVDAPFITQHPRSRSAVVGNPLVLSVRAFGAAPLTYQWQKDGVNISGATSQDYAIPVVGPDDGGIYRANVSNAHGTATSKNALIDVFGADPIGQALEFTGQTWSNGGDAAWFPQTSVTYDGVDALQSGDIDNEESSAFSFSITGPVDLSFQWKASSESFWDPVRLSIDGAEIASLSGEKDWHRQLMQIPEGPHAVAWTYEKDETVSDGADAAWVDQLENFDIDGYLNEAVETENLEWVVDGASWYVQNENTNDGQDALRSGPITHGESSRLETAVTGPRTISFSWRVSSEAGGDLLAFEVNGVRLASVSGTVEWEEREFELPAGENTLIWRYIKNGFGTLGLDAGWLDELRITSAPVIDTQPQDTVIPIGASAELSVVAVGAEPLTYQWYAGERGDISQPVVGAVGATFTTPALSVESRYWVRVTNDLGTTDSDAATVIVDNLPVAGDFLKAGDEDTDFVFDLSDFTDAFSDPDAGDTLIAIRVPELPDPGVLLLHSAPVAVDEAFPAEDLGSLVFRPEDNWNGEVTFTWIANDGLLESETPGVVTLRVDPVNDPPSVLAPVSVLAEKKIGVRINGIDVADPDAGLADVTVTISAGHGTLTIGEDTAGGLTASEINGNGTTDLELTGNLGAINTSLSVAPGMVYLNKLNFVGEDVLSITIDDEGNAGSGGPLDATEDVEISVTGTLYDVWLIENFDATDLEDPQKENLVWGDRADPDNDRLLNLVESFMGLDPRLRDDARFPRIENAGAALRFVYRRSKNAPGVGGTAEWSIDAVGWSSDGIVETITEDLGDAEVVEAPVPVGGEGAIFMRLRITR